MGEIVTFPSNGGTGSGYLATPREGPGPGLVVIQEWWGLVDHIEDVCDRFAAEGFTALAPDLFHGATAAEPDEAGKLMMSLNLEQAGKDMGGAIDHLLGMESVAGDTIGVTGFCMGGGLALLLAVQRPDAVKAVVPFYGLIPWPSAEPDWSKLQAAVLGHYAGQDGFFGPDKVEELRTTLTDLGKEVELNVYAGVDHAFFNDTRPEVYDAGAATLAWERTLAFLRDKVATT